MVKVKRDQGMQVAGINVIETFDVTSMQQPASLLLLLNIHS